jgi:hypothetical protein
MTQVWQPIMLVCPRNGDSVRARAIVPESFGEFAPARKPWGASAVEGFAPERQEVRERFTMSEAAALQFEVVRSIVGLLIAVALVLCLLVVSISRQ